MGLNIPSVRKLETLHPASLLLLDEAVPGSASLLLPQLLTKIIPASCFRLSSSAGFWYVCLGSRVAEDRAGEGAQGEPGLKLVACGPAGFGEDRRWPLTGQGSSQLGREA